MEIPGISIISVIFIVLIIVPGVFAKRFYFLGAFSKQFGAGQFADRLITSIFWGFIVQVLTFFAYSRYFGFTLLDLKDYLTDGIKQLNENKLPEKFDQYNLWMILGYIVASIVMSALSGMTAHILIRAIRLDTKFRAFRYANQWHYYFSGEILRSRPFRSKRKKIISTSADVVLDSGDQKTKMFRGILSQYTISAKTGELETLILTDVQKYNPEEKKFNAFPGDFFMIPYNKVIDINIRYESPENTGTTNYSQITFVIVQIFIVLSFVASFIFPWLLGLSFLRSLGGTFLLLSTWLFFSIILTNIFNTVQKGKLDKGALSTAVVLFLLLLYTSISVLELKPIIYNALANLFR